MKGISHWLWVFGGIVIALIIFLIAYNQMLLSNNAIIEQRSIDQFNEIAGKLNTLCWSYVGTEVEITANLGSMVEGIYAANIPYEEYEKEQLINNIILNKTLTGNYLCLKIEGKRLNCKQFECSFTFPFIGSVPKEFSLSALISSAMGKGNIYSYLLYLKRDEYGISVFVSGQEPTPVTSTTVPGVTTTIPGATTTAPGVTTTTPGATTTTTPGPTTTIVAECKSEELVKLVSSNEMIGVITELIKNPRNYGSDWNKQTADFIADKLRSYGVDNVHFEDFEYSGIKGRNVVGEVGTGTNVIVVTGGHRDSPPNDWRCFSWPCYGAVDNAGGVAATMEAARVLAACKDYIKTYKLRFVLFDGEEIYLLGSEAYAEEHMDKNGENINRMINLDCIGDKGLDTLTVYRTADDLSNSADKCCQSLNIKCERVFGAGAGSDHLSFSARGAKIMWIENGCGTCYHQSCDDLSLIGAAQMEWAGKLTTCVLSDMYLK